MLNLFRSVVCHWLGHETSAGMHDMGILFQLKDEPWATTTCARCLFLRPISDFAIWPAIKNTAAQV